jgi:protein required for attachment to host cells
MRPIRTLVVLASEAETRLCVGEGPGHGLREVAALRAADFPDTDQGFDDTPGRQRSGPGMARHAFPARESAQDARRTTFARLTLDAVAEQWQAGGYDRIVLAAAPKLLGELRRQMPKELAAAVSADLAKDLVKIPQIELPGHLAGVMDV